MDQVFVMVQGTVNWFWGHPIGSDHFTVKVSAPNGDWSISASILMDRAVAVAGMFVIW